MSARNSRRRERLAWERLSAGAKHAALAARAEGGAYELDVDFGFQTVQPIVRGVFSDATTLALRLGGWRPRKGSRRGLLETWEHEVMR